MIYETILDAVGHTPLIRLQRMTGPEDAQILVKLEAVGIGGSIKTRTALTMLRQAWDRGEIGPGSKIVEATSGNQGIGLALAGAVLGLDVCIIMPDSVSQERRSLVSQYGARLVLIPDEGDIGTCIDRCVQTAQQMAKEDPSVYLPRQFSNPDNILAHFAGTGAEILEQAGDLPLDGFVVGFGTGGTLTGVGRALRSRWPQLTIWAAEPEHAAILSGGAIGTHIQMGIGDGIIPENLDRSLIDDCCIITDDEAVEASRRLAREEGLLCGISSGTNVAAALRLARKLGPGKTVVTILPDTGERYFSTPLYR